MEEKLNKAEKLAREVLFMSRDTLLVNLRFLDLAISQLELNANGFIPFGTDGRYLYYLPMHVLLRFKKNKEQVTRDYLHALLHCVYRHMFVSPTIDCFLWDVACDIAIENVISELGLPSVLCGREAAQKPMIDRLKSQGVLLTAEKIYSHLKNEGLSDEKLSDIREAFFADYHDVWYANKEERGERENEKKTRQNGGKSDQERENDQDSESGQDSENGQDGGNDQDGENDQDGGNTQDSRSSTSSSSGIATSVAELIEAWKKAAERMQVDIETFGKQRGDTPGGMLMNLKEVNREKYDYTAFLKKFAVMGEAMKINDDEFDYIFYTYGLKLYEKMPLIEPLEYKEVKRIKEFVIAIDTSGSVAGDLVQQFVQKTYNILKSTESFFSKINLHIIQCDADIQEHIRITTKDEFDEYLKNMQIKGLGGTDFRPVFTKVDELIKNKEFFNLKGLIYFTDGYGVFPERKPNYETAFVFVNDQYEIPDVPPWAIKLILESNDI